ncbi:MAG: hypothetical protein KF718_18495 [Polyangiaceae bacterium]|nr:hypothetical protein [Polyangiaceae bacterium]
MSRRLSWVLALPLLWSCGPPILPPPLPAESAAGETRTVDGEILGVDRQAPSARLSEQVRLVVTPGKESPVEIWLAPAWYLEERGLTVSPKQRIRVEGRQQAGQSGGIEAQRVRLGDRVFELRDAAGRPLWNER